MINQDEKYMRQAIKLALKGVGKVSPNPLVGCVVLDKCGNVISKGYHKKYGDNHAERDALLKVKNNEAEGGTLYVNLEPCSHQGKTPPCTDIIIEKKIKRVVYGMKDINPKVDGISVLKKAGIEVVGGIMENEAKFLNRVFIKNMTKNLPYIVLKTATTMDGKIGTKTGDSKWITSNESRKAARKIRKVFDCIMTSSNTVISDNPRMEHRFKCILDKNNRVPKDSIIYNQGKVLTINSDIGLKDGQIDLLKVMKLLYSKGVCSVFVECGGTLAGALLREGLIDEIYQFIGAKILNDNNGKSCFDGDNILNIDDSIKLKIYEVKKFDEDILIKSTVCHTHV